MVKFRFYYFLNAVPLVLDKRKAALADPESIKTVKSVRKKKSIKKQQETYFITA